MIDHLGINCADYAKSQAFYDTVLGAFHAAAIGVGAESLHAPRLWPEYHSPRFGGYFGAFVRDPDGNNVEAVWHGGP